MKPAIENRNTLLEEASGWFIRIRNDDLTDDELELWTQWLATSPEHQRAFDDIQTLWENSGVIFNADVDDAPAETVANNKVSQNEAGRHGGEAPAPQLKISAALARPAVAAAIMLAIATAIISIGRYSFDVLQGDASVSHYATNIAERKEITLSDGSVMILGPLSEASVNYTSSSRNIQMQDGIAYFIVAQNKDRPFLVNAADGVVRATGTRFSVEQKNDTVTVLVSEGAVEVTKVVTNEKTPSGDRKDNYKQIVQLVSGQQLVYSDDADIAKSTQIDISTETAWLRGQLFFKDEPLGSAIDEINRYSHAQIVLKGQDVRDLRITSALSISQIDEWLDGLTKVLPVTVERSSEKILIASKNASGECTSPSSCDDFDH